MTTPEVAAEKEDARPARCGGEGCDVRGPWPLYHVHHGTVFCRLCTSCVLKYHPGSFCVFCFEILDGATRLLPQAVLRCSRCPSVTHSTCHLESCSSSSSGYVCPSCANPDGFSYFPVVNGREKAIDLKSARALLAAAQLASATMRRAAASSRAEAEEKVRGAALARKAVRKMLETPLQLSNAEKEKEKDRQTAVNGMSLPKQPEYVDRKMKKPKPCGTVAAISGEKRIQHRESEKWMRSQELIGMAQKLTESILNDKIKLAPSTKVQNHMNSVETKDKLGSLPPPLNHAVKVKIEDKRVAEVTQDGFKEKAVLGTC